jgi:hypothetical protein
MEVLEQVEQELSFSDEKLKQKGFPGKAIKTALGQRMCKACHPEQGRIFPFARRGIQTSTKKNGLTTFDNDHSYFLATVEGHIILARPGRRIQVGDHSRVVHVSGKRAWIPYRPKKKNRASFGMTTFDTPCQTAV